MKSEKFAFLYFAILFLSIGLLGCKPKETNLTGQVFIATAGGTSFRLGAVEILLIEKQQVTDFLNKEQAAIDLKTQSQKEQLVAAKKTVEKTKIEADNAQKEFDSFVQSKSWQTNDDYTNAEAELVQGSNGIAAWDKQMDILKSQNLSAAYPRPQPGWEEFYFRASLQNNPTFKSRWDAANKSRQLFVDKDELANLEMSKIEKAAMSVANEQLATRRFPFFNAQSSLETIQASLNNTPTAETYLADFSPIVVEKAVTDADGNFLISYPQNKKFTIFARAQRAVLDSTEKYCWLVDAPSGTETGRISLNNQNLVEFDPDGYFKLNR